MNKYTPYQREVIKSQSNKLLVSASAGTGKTTVMVERIYRLIASGKVDVSNLLVVTFTTLAAAEMKQRLMAKLIENSTDAIIAQQLEKIDQCSISTVHSFCSDIIRNYFYVVGVDPSYSIIDDVTASKFKQQALDQCIAHAEQDDAFVHLYDMLSNKRKDTELRKCILDQYEFGKTLIDYGSWYNNSRQKYLELDQPGNQLTQLMLDNLYSNMQEIGAQWSEVGTMLDSFGLTRHAQESYANSVECCTTHSSIDGTIKWICGLGKRTIYKLEKDKMPQGVDVEDIKAVTEPLKTLTNKTIATYAKLFGNKSWQQLVQMSHDNVIYTDKIVELALDFSARYSDMKKSRGMLDFNDLEHLTLDVLQDTQALENIRSRYTMVFVDEYQDTNSVQDAIFSAISSNNSLFAVGDIKQSIYAFRGSDPTLFLDKYNSFSQPDSGQVVELNKNFRSDTRILDFANMVFGHIMTKSFGKVDYRRTAMLEGELQCSSHIPAVSIDFVDKSIPEEVPLTVPYDITIPTSNDSTAEGIVVSQRIASVVGSVVTLDKGKKHKIGYGDIAILCRSYNERVDAVYSQLVADNIPVYTTMNADSSKGKEIRDIISLLRVLDNATDDISMVGVCRSCIGGLSEQQLADIKIYSASTKCSFVGRMRTYLDNHQDDIAVKCNQLLQLIDRLRLVAHSSTVHNVVLELMDSTDYHLHVEAMPNGHLRTRQLYQFVDRLVGKSYNQSVDKYLQYIDSDKSGKDKDGVSANNAVRMMTMHSAKGLEFPVVIIIDSNKGFKKDYPKLYCDANCGLALDYYDFDSMTKQNTIGGHCTALNLSAKAKEEEMRVLYVALTRAKYHLFIVARDSKLINTSSNKVLSANSYAQWIMSAVNASSIDGTHIGGVSITQWTEQMLSSIVKIDSRLLCEQSSSDNIVESMDYVYPHNTNTPTKVVSSLLDKAHLEQPEADTVVALAQYDRTPMLIGTAYHAVYEQINATATIDDIDNTIVKLVHAGIIATDIAEHIDSKLVYDTINNPQLIELMQGKVYREIPFMLNTAIGDILPEDSDDTVILQGIIDMLVVNGNSATVIDYKYVNSTYELDKRYGRQLASYKLAVNKITGITDVQCYILSIKDNKLFKIV